MATLTSEIIEDAAWRAGINPYIDAFLPKDLGIKASNYGSFSDYCNNTKSSTHNKRIILTATAFNKGNRPKKYKLIPTK